MTERKLDYLEWFLAQTSSFLWAGIINHINLLILGTDVLNSRIWRFTRRMITAIFASLFFATEGTEDNHIKRLYENLQTYVCW